MSAFLDKGGLRVFFQLPIRHSATLTGPFVPLIPEPPGQAAVLRAFNRDVLVAVSGYGHHIALELYGTHPVEKPITRGQKLNLIYNIIQVFAFPEPLPFPLSTALIGGGTLWFH